ncbi:hypothetical protein ABNB59_11210 [Paenibacillus larvae]
MTVLCGLFRRALALHGGWSDPHAGVKRHEEKVYPVKEKGFASGAVRFRESEKEVFRHFPE